jgi:hypothetical protein
MEEKIEVNDKSFQPWQVSLAFMHLLFVPLVNPYLICREQDVK